MNTNLINEYPKNIWCIDKNNSNIAIKQTNTKTIKVPITTEILEEIKKQIEASLIFKAFQKVTPEDKNLIGYINLILNDYINFLDEDTLNKLIIELKKMEQSNQLDNQNNLYLNNMIHSLEINDRENFEELLEQFSNYNQNHFFEEQTTKKH